MVKASRSRVALLAANTMSPSFSRLASSTTTIARPAAEQPLHVLGDHVDLEVDHVAGLLAAERGARERLGDQADLDPVAAERGDRQADPVDGDRAFLHDVTRKRRRDRYPHDVPALAGPALADRAGPVHVALHQVPAEPAAQRQRALQVHRRALAEGSEAGAAQRLAHDVGAERAVR